MLELRNVSKSYGETQALHPSDLSIGTGETAVLIGPSGCGKSTILRLMNGLIEPDTGTVQFEGERLTEANIRAARYRMGYVIQEGGLFPHMTNAENITLMARHLGREKQWTEDRLRELCKLTHFDEGNLTSYPSELSGGQRQRVSLMRALMLEPEVLLLDEPLGALDPMIRSELQEELSSIFEDLGITVVLVTHDLAEAVFFADRIVLMRDGHIVQHDTPEQIFNNPANGFVGDFISAQRNVHSFGEEA